MKPENTHDMDLGEVRIYSSATGREVYRHESKDYTGTPGLKVYRALLNAFRDAEREAARAALHRAADFIEAEIMWVDGPYGMQPKTVYDALRLQLAKDIRELEV